MDLSFRSIWLSLTQWFKKQPDSYKHYFSIVFNLNQDNDVDIRFFWPDLDKVSKKDLKEIAKNYSALISIINAGAFKTDIIKILLDSQKQTACSSDKFFISTTLQYLADTANLGYSDQKPVISPTKVFK